MLIAHGAWRGALGASPNDDWTYYRVAFATASDGGFHPDPYTRAMLVGLDYLSLPVVTVFGPSIPALQILVAVLGGVGLWCAHMVLRRFLSTSMALVCTWRPPVRRSTPSRRSRS